MPCVVMGHGGSGTKRLGLPGYAQAFASHGMAVVAFDYRYFGASDGEPRQIIDVAEQQADYRAAVRYVRGYDGIDPERVALWSALGYLAQRRSRPRRRGQRPTYRRRGGSGADDRWLASRPHPT